MMNPVDVRDRWTSKSFTNFISTWESSYVNYSSKYGMMIFESPNREDEEDRLMAEITK